jgi:hypothetical protein
MTKFGSKKIIIKPFSVSEDMRQNWMDAILRWADISIIGCWNWTGRIHNGYPCIWAPGCSSTLWAHRVSYALFNGPIKAGMQIDHKCINPICVRPSHLEQVTPSENYRRIKVRKIIKGLRDGKQGKLFLHYIRFNSIP